MQISSLLVIQLHKQGLTLNAAENLAMNCMHTTFSQFKPVIAVSKRRDAQLKPEGEERESLTMGHALPPTSTRRHHACRKALLINFSVIDWFLWFSPQARVLPAGSTQRLPALCPPHPLPIAIPGGRVLGSEPSEGWERLGENFSSVFVTAPAHGGPSSASQCPHRAVWHKGHPYAVMFYSSLST